MNNSNGQNRGRDPAERLWGFLESAASKSVVERHGAWVRTPAGIIVMTHLHAAAALRLEGLLTKSIYDAAIVELASKTEVSLADLRIMAEGVYEVNRCNCLAACTTNTVAGDWNSNGGEAA